jgi:hypothetical protein
MTTLTARMEVVLEEVSMDIRDFIRNMFGQPNDNLSRAMIQHEISMYFDQHPDIDSGFVQCDDANNPPEAVRDGKLNVAMHIVVDGVLFAGVGQVDPLNQSVVDAEVNFFLQHISPRATIMNAVPEVRGNHNEMPDALARTLGM